MRIENSLAWRLADVTMVTGGGDATVEPIGDLISRLRDERGLTQGQMATFARVTRSWVTQVETGRRIKPDSDRLKRVAAVLHVPADTLLASAGYSTGYVERPTERTPEEALTEAMALLRIQRERQAREEAERKRAEIEAGLIKPIPGKLLILPIQRQPLSADATLTGYLAEEVAFYDAPTNADPERYQAFYVAGDCLQGRIEPGTTIVVDCWAVAEPGDIVAVHNGDLLIKILTEVSDGRYLTTLNGQPPIRVTEETRILGVVVQVTHKP